MLALSILSDSKVTWKTRPKLSCQQGDRGSLRVYLSATESLLSTQSLVQEELPDACSGRPQGALPEHTGRLEQKPCLLWMPPALWVTPVPKAACNSLTWVRMTAVTI